MACITEEEVADTEVAGLVLGEEGVVTEAVAVEAAMGAPEEDTEEGQGEEAVVDMGVVVGEGVGQ
jgi:hypothetical protein